MMYLKSQRYQQLGRKLLQIIRLLKIKCEIGDTIRRKLKIDQTPSISAIVMDQFKQEFDKMDKQNQYRVLA